MADCATCGNDYARAFEVRTHDGQTLVFDSIECAAHLIAPLCRHCGCRVLGHGIEAADGVFCCAHCAHQTGADAARDNVVEGAR